MSGKRYNQEAKDRALGALMASAVLVDGEWVPNVKAVERQVGIHERTLSRWWGARDVSEDADLRGAVTRARAVVRQEGVKDFLTKLHQQCKDRLLWATDPGREEPMTTQDGEGRIVVLAPATRADAMAKAVEIAARVGAQLDVMTSDKPGQAGDNRTAAVLANARRVGLIPAEPDDSR